MDQAAVKQFIISTLSNVEIVESSGGTFVFDGPDHKFPFITITTSDEYDQHSNLNRPGVFRLNIGVGKQTFGDLFADRSTTHDFKAIDQIMPHPVYGMMYWICVLNPSDATFKAIQPLLAEAHKLAIARSQK